MNKDIIKELGIAIDTRTPKEQYKEDLEPFVLETIQKPELSGTPGKILEILKGESVKIAKIYLDIVKNNLDNLSTIN